MFLSPGSRQDRKRPKGGGGGVTVPLDLNGGTVSASTPVLTIEQTMNNSSAFVGVKWNFTYTGTDAFTSSAFQIQRNGANGFAVGEDGSIYTGAQPGQIIVGSAPDGTGTQYAIMGFNQLALQSGSPLRWSNSGSANGTVDAGLSRVTTGVVASGNGNNADATGWLQWGGEKRTISAVTFTSTTVLGTVTGLTVNVQAGRTYKFMAKLYITSMATAGGVQAAIAGTATATSIVYSGYEMDTGATPVHGFAVATALGTQVALATGTTGTVGVIEISGTITVNAAGTLLVQAAQGASNATATTIGQGSWFEVHDYP